MCVDVCVCVCWCVCVCRSPMLSAGSEGVLLFTQDETQSQAESEKNNCSLFPGKNAAHRNAVTWERATKRCWEVMLMNDADL